MNKLKIRNEEPNKNSKQIIMNQSETRKHKQSRNSKPKTISILEIMNQCETRRREQNLNSKPNITSKLETMNQCETRNQELIRNSRILAKKSQTKAKFSLRIIFSLFKFESIGKTSIIYNIYPSISNEL